MMSNIRDVFERLLRRRSHYRAVFSSASGRVVLADLQSFCYGNKPTIRNSSTGVDPYASLIAAARQEVYMRITNHLNLSDAELLNLKSQGDSNDSSN